jgi:hypothetical protein
MMYLFGSKFSIESIESKVWTFVHWSGLEFFMPSFPGTFRSFVKFFLQLSRISTEYPTVGRVKCVRNVPKKRSP